MAFANEVRDFIDAFQVGATIKDKYKRRKLDEESEANKLTIAANKLKHEEGKFNKIYDQNQYKITSANKLKESELGLREQDLARKRDADKSVAGYRSGSLAVQRDRNKAIQDRADAAAAEKARKARIAADPTSEFDPENALPTSVTPSSGAQPSSGIPVSESATPKKGGGIPVANIPGPAGPPIAAATALAGGLKYLQEHFGLNAGIQGAGAQAKDGARRLFEGEGSQTPEEQAAIDKILDEEDIANGIDPASLTESMRALRKLTVTYDKFNKLGRTEDANKMAAGIIQTSRGIASMLGSSAIKKAEAGDMDGAIADVIAAHDQIPDGRSVKYDPKSKTFTVADEETGEVLEEGQVTPEMVLAVANGMKDGSAFYKIVMSAASRDPSMQNKKDPTAPKEPKELDVMKPEDREALGSESSVQDAVMAEFTNMDLPDGTKVFEGMDPAAIEEQIGADSLAAINDLGGMIAHYNGLRPEQAGKLALSIVNPNLEGKNPYSFKLINSDQNTMEIMAEDGTRLRLPARTAASMIKRGHTGLMTFAKAQQERTVGESQKRVDSMANLTKAQLENARSGQKVARDEMNKALTQSEIERSDPSQVMGINPNDPFMAPRRSRRGH